MDISAEQEQELDARFGRLERKVETLTEELTSTRHELERQIGDEQSDRERADDAIKSDLDSLRHDVQYG